MFKRTKVNTGALIALGSVLMTAGLSVQAQTAERIEITGSRIKSIGNTSSSPITSVGKVDIDTTQPVAVEELVRGLSSSYPAIGPGVNNGSAGIASIDLRGLGTNRTLVLVNGKRFVPSNLRGVVDTNNVPVSLLERVDLVTGGASAVYGADAVSGVVNFVTKRNFTGVEATTLYSVSESNDAKRYKSDLTMGANLADGRGNVAIHVGTTRTNPIRLGDRDYANTVISSSTGLPGGFSGTSVPAVFSGMPTPINGSRVIDATTGLLRAAVTSGPPDGYNTNPPNYFETPLTRTQVTGLGRFTINDYAEAYAEIFHTRSNVTLNLAPSGTFGVALNIPIGNPFITQPVRNQLCAAYGISTANCVAGNATEFRANVARRFVEAGPRVYSYDNVTTQYTTGLRGAIPYLDSWSYDAYYQQGRSDQQQTTANGFGATKLQQAVRATSTTGCTVTTGGCVPINLFGGAGTITPEMLAFISTPTFQTTQVTQKVMSLSANGEIAVAKSPFAKNPLGLAIGYEQRTVFGGNKSDAVVQTQGELLGSGAPTPDRSGELKFKETYVEANMPLVQNMPGVQSLSVGVGYRDTEFKTTASQNYGSWKGGFDWAPIKGLRFRAEQQRATRAPNVNELYAPVTTGLATLSIDPCQGNLIGTGPTTGLTAAQIAARPQLTVLCQQTGVPAAQVGSVASPSSSQVNNTSGGNPALKPEKADTTTFGLVWEPDFVPNLSMTLDFWKIKIDEAVSSATASQVVDGCFSTTLNPGFGYNAFCQSIQRDALNGGLNGTGSKGIITQSSNLGGYNYSGVDFGANYRLQMSKVGAPTLGRVDFGIQLSHLRRADFKALPTVATLEQAGYYGLDVGTPYMKTKFSQRTTWAFSDFSVGYNWRYLGASKVQPDRAANYLPENTSIKAVSYIDLNGTWQAMKNLKLSLTLNNAFNKKPPLIGTGIIDGAYNFGNTIPLVYDVIGRRYTVSATATF
jgi:outer membrane receptor protein involved in Fe transport